MTDTDKVSLKKYAIKSEGFWIIILLWIVFFYLIISNNMHTENSVLLLCSLLVCIVLMSIISYFGLYYIEITRKEIRVKNLFFFWIHKIYEVKSIDRIEINFNQRQPRLIIHNTKLLTKDSYYLSYFNTKFKKRLVSELKKVAIKLYM